MKKNQFQVKNNSVFILFSWNSDHDYITNQESTSISHYQP